MKRLYFLRFLFLTLILSCGIGLQPGGTYINVFAADESESSAEEISDDPEYEETEETFGEEEWEELREIEELEEMFETEDIADDSDDIWNFEEDAVLQPEESSEESLQDLIDRLAEEGDVEGLDLAALEMQEEKDHGVAAGDENALLIAHTGMAGKAAQNSAAAFDLAGQNGYWGIETDLRWTKDHVLVCFHDDSLEKHTNGSGSVAGRNWSYLKKLYVNAGNTKKYGAQPIATFEEYLDICKAYGCNAIIDIKYCSNGYKKMLRAAYDMIVEKDMLGMAVFQCSVESYLDAVREIDKDVRIWLLVGKKGAWDGDKIRRAYKRWNCEAVNAPVADSSIAKAIHSYGMLYAFYQTDNTKLQKQYFGKGVDLIMENGR